MQQEDLIAHGIKELDRLYDQAAKQLSGIRALLDTIHHYAKNFVQTGELNGEKYRMSNEAWMERAQEAINDLMRVDKQNFPTQNSILSTIYLKLRDVYGVVIQQMKKDYREKYDILRYPSAFEAISDDDRVRSVFDSILISLFPPSYFKDEAVELMERVEERGLPEGENGQNDSRVIHVDDVRDVDAYGHPDQDEEDENSFIMSMLEPLANELKDDSEGYNDTFKLVCDSMDCNWRLLKSRYKNKHNMKETPSNEIIINDNKQVAAKFKRTIRMLNRNLCNKY